MLNDFRELEAQDLAGQVSIINPFNVELTHLVYAGADTSLVPSSFEPCGLVAPCSMMNGTIPVARAVGGPIDIINEGQNGFLVHGDWYKTEGDHNFNALVDGFVDKILIVDEMMRNRGGKLNPFIARMLHEDHSWGPAAREYVELYREIIARFNVDGHYKAFGHF